MKNAFSKLLRVFTRNFANNKIENETKQKPHPKNLYFNFSGISLIFSEHVFCSKNLGIAFLFA